MKNLIQNGRRVLATAVLGALLPLAANVHAAAAAEALRSRSVTAVERTDLTREIVTRFGQPEPAETSVSAAGPFRFVNAPGLLYMDRSDLGSVGFENARYGVDAATLDAATVSRSRLGAQIDRALQRTGLVAEGRVFDGFNDEYEGNGQPDAMGPGFDPRQVSRHVARTAVYTRQIDGVPVFGSELTVGLMPDGSIGRFRLHWPAIDTALVQQAQALQQSLQAQRWQAAQRAQPEGAQVLETRAGIAHTGFADPGFAARAVVRVLYRQTSGEGPLALSSTGYRYYDAEGREVTLGGVPATAGTAAALKGKGSR